MWSAGSPTISSEVNYDLLLVCSTLSSTASGCTTRSVKPMLCCENVAWYSTDATVVYSSRNVLPIQPPTQCSKIPTRTTAFAPRRCHHMIAFPIVRILLKYLSDWILELSTKSRLVCKAKIDMFISFQSYSKLTMVFIKTWFEHFNSQYAHRRNLLVQMFLPYHIASLKHLVLFWRTYVVLSDCVPYILSDTTT